MVGVSQAAKRDVMSGYCANMRVACVINVTHSDAKDAKDHSEDHYEARRLAVHDVEKAAEW